jgi:hypothetical protein
VRRSNALGGGRYPGIRSGVRAMLSFQFSPPRFLYVYAETKPDINPKRTYRIIMTVVRAPRLLGDRNPSIANTKTLIMEIRLNTCSRADHHEQLRSAAE